MKVINDGGQDGIPASYLYGLTGFVGHTVTDDKDCDDDDYSIDDGFN